MYEGGGAIILLYTVSSMLVVVKLILKAVACDFAEKATMMQRKYVESALMEVSQAVGEIKLE